MGEEAAAVVDLELIGGDEEEDEEERVMEWVTGLPDSDELTPLSQPLVPPGLAAAFRIAPEPGRTLLDVHRASAATVSRLRRASSSSAASSFPAFKAAAGGGGGGESLSSNNNNNNNKRARLVWTPQLHRRFVEVVAHLGIKNAVPKTIMQLMNVDGLTRENVASHLQKYRLYVKRMQQGLSNSPSDHIFASTPVPYDSPPPVYAGSIASSYHHHHRISSSYYHN